MSEASFVTLHQSVVIKFTAAFYVVIVVINPKYVFPSVLPFVRLASFYAHPRSLSTAVCLCTLRSICQMQLHTAKRVRSFIRRFSRLGEYQWSSDDLMTSSPTTAMTWCSLILIAAAVDINVCRNLISRTMRLSCQQQRRSTNCSSIL